MRKARILALMTAVFMLIAGMQVAQADGFYASSDYFAYFSVGNKGLMELDLETDETILYAEYLDMRGLTIAPDGDLLINTGYEIINTDLYERQEKIFSLDPEGYDHIYHTRIFDGLLYVAITDGRIYSMNSDGTDCRLITDDAYLYDFVVNGTDLYYCDGTAMYWLDLQNESPEPQIVVNDIVTYLDIHDGVVYFVFGTDHSLCALEDNGEFTHIIPRGVLDFAILPDGKRAAVIMKNDSSLKVVDIETGMDCAVVADECSDVAADENGFYYMTMQSAQKYNEYAVFSVHRVNEDYSSTTIGDK